MVAAGFSGCMVDRWTRMPFKPRHPPPGFTPAALAAWSDACAAGPSYCTPGPVQARTGGSSLPDVAAANVCQNVSHQDFSLNP